MRKIKVGYQLDFRNPPNSGRTFQEVYAEMLAQAEFAHQMMRESRHIGKILLIP